jgi:hypothetical protein
MSDFRRSGWENAQAGRENHGASWSIRWLTKERDINMVDVPRTPDSGLCSTAAAVRMSMNVDEDEKKMDTRSPFVSSHAFMQNITMKSTNTPPTIIRWLEYRALMLRHRTVRSGCNDI